MKRTISLILAAYLVMSPITSYASEVQPDRNLPPAVAEEITEDNTQTQMPDILKETEESNNMDNPAGSTSGNPPIKDDPLTDMNMPGSIEEELGAEEPPILNLDNSVFDRNKAIGLTSFDPNYISPLEPYLAPGLDSNDAIYSAPSGISSSEMKRWLEDIAANNDEVIPYEIWASYQPKKRSVIGENNTNPIFAFSAHSQVLLAPRDGGLIVWGDNTYGQLGLGSDEKFIRNPTRVPFFEDKYVINVMAIANFSIVITSDFKCYMSGGQGGHTYTIHKLPGDDAAVIMSWATLKTFTESARYSTSRVIAMEKDTTGITGLVTLNSTRKTYKVTGTTATWGGAFGPIEMDLLIDREPLIFGQNSVFSVSKKGTNWPHSLSGGGYYSVGFTNYPGKWDWFSPNLINVPTLNPAYYLEGNNPDLVAYPGDAIDTGYGSAYTLIYLAKEANGTQFTTRNYNKSPSTITSGGYYSKRGPIRFGDNPYFQIIPDTSGPPRTNIFYNTQGVNEFYNNLTGFRILTNNTVQVAGSNATGKAGVGVNDATVGEQLVHTLTGKNIQHIDGTFTTTFFVGATGRVYASGDNSSGQLGQGSAYFNMTSNLPLEVNWGLISDYSISVSPTPGGTVVPNKTKAKEGDTITVAVSPNTGYELVPGTLKYNGIGIAGNSFVMPDANVTLTAQFRLKLYPVSIYNTPNGTLTPSRATAAPGTAVSITVRPATNYRLKPGSLKYNSVPMSGTSFTMPDGPVTVSADFELTPHQVFITQAPNGLIQSSITTAYPGDRVTLIISPTVGYALKPGTLKMNGSLITGSSFTMPATNVTITAAFEASSYAVSIHPSANGTVSVDKPSARPGDVVNVTASANKGYALKANGILLNNTPINGTSFSMPLGPANVTALFEQMYYTVTAQAPNNGTLSVNKAMASYGESVTVSANPSPGYKLKDGGLAINGVPVSGTVFPMPNTNVVATAEFEPILYTITVDNRTEGAITVNKTEAYTGEMVTANVFPTDGYRVRAGSLKYDGNPISGTQFRMPPNNTLLTCEFDVVYNNVIVNQPSQGTLVVSKPTAMLGDTIVVTASPNKGYQMLPGAIKANGEAIQGNSFLMPLKDVTVTVDFTPITYDIEVQKSSLGKIVPTKTSANINDLVELSILPNEGYRVKTGSLRVNGVSRDQDNFVMPAANVLITCDFEPVLYPIDVETASGGLTKSDRSTAKIGDQVKLQTIPDTGYAFKSDSIVVNGSPITGKTFVMKAEDTKIESTYEAIVYDVSVIQPDNGMVRADKKTANINDVITISIDPDEGYSLIAGSLRINGVTNSGSTFIMPANDVTITALMEPIQYGIDLPNVPNGRVYTSQNTATIGEDIRISVVPNSGYELKENSLTMNGAIVSSTFKMPAKNVSMRYEFEPIIYDITTPAVDNGKVEVSTATASIGDQVKIEILPDIGYRLVSNSIRVNGVVTSGGSFIMRPENTAVTAEFEPILYTIKPITLKNGSLIPDKVSSTIGESVSVSIVPDVGYKYVEGSLKADGVAVEKGTFEMPAKNVELTAAFERIVYTISSLTTDNGETIPSENKASIGDAITLDAIPDSGYQLIAGSIKINGKTQHGLSFVMPAENVTISSGYEPIVYTVRVVQSDNGTTTVDKYNATIGQDVRITAKPDRGYRVKEASILVNGKPISGTLFKMPASYVEVNVTYEKTPYSIKTLAVTNGTITTDKTTANMYDRITVNATPKDGYHLVTGSVTANGVAQVGTTFTMPPEDVKVYAEFKAIDFNVQAIQPSNGTITLDKYSATVGQEVNVTIKPARGYRLLSGSLKINDSVIQDNRFAMPAGTAKVTCEFERILYDIDLQVKDNGKARIDKVQAYYGEDLILTLEPNPGFSVGPTTVKVNGSSISGTTFTMPDKNTVVLVDFDGVAYNLIPGYFNGGRVSFDKTYARVEEEVEVIGEPDSGYRLIPETVRVNGNITPSLKFKMPARDVKVEAAFEKVNVEGIVVDPSSMPVPGIEVILTSGYYTDKVKSEMDGTFKFSVVPNGTFVVKTNDYTWTNDKKDVVVSEGKVEGSAKTQLIIDRDRSIERVEEMISKLPAANSSQSQVMNASSSIHDAKFAYDELTAEQRPKVNKDLVEKLRILFAKITPVQVEVLSSLRDVDVKDVELSINKEQHVTLDSPSKASIKLQVFVNPLDSPTPEEEILTEEKLYTGESVQGYIDISVYQTLNNGTPEQINELTKPVTVSLGLEEKATGVKYKVVRIHDDTADILPLLSKDEMKITFKTDKFSTYAIVANQDAPGIKLPVMDAEMLFWENIIQRVKNSGPWDSLMSDISGKQNMPVAVVQSINDWTGEAHFSWSEESFTLTGKFPILVEEQRMFYPIEDLIKLAQRNIKEEGLPEVISPVVPSAPPFVFDYEKLSKDINSTVSSIVSQAMPSNLLSLLTGKSDVTPLDTAVFMFNMVLLIIVICIAITFLTPTAKLVGVRVANALGRKIKRKKKRKNNLTMGLSKKLSNSMSPISRAGDSLALFVEKTMSREKVTKPKGKRWSDKFKNSVKVPEQSTVIEVPVGDISEVSLQEALNVEQSDSTPELSDTMPIQDEDVILTSAHSKAREDLFSLTEEIKDEEA